LRSPVFRIAQEALNNVAKHAAANQVRMALALQGRDAVLSVSDERPRVRPGGDRA